MITQTKKMDWKKIADKITADKARIAAHLRDPNSTPVDDITFLTPLSLPLDKPRAGESL